MARKTSPKTPEKPDSSRLIGALEEKVPAEFDSFLIDGPIDEIKELVVNSYCSELVNLLLDAKKASVRAFFLRAIGVCKRAVTPVITLYSYRVYLSNPLPLSLKGGDGEIHINYYALLGVHLNVTDDEVSSSYKLLAKAHAPDAFSPRHRKLGEERLMEIKASLKMLKTVEAREAAATVLSSHPEHCFPRRDASWLEIAASFLG